MSMIEIPGYTMQRMLGRGGMATVYLAIQDKFERDVALKVMARALSADEGFRERFMREAKIVAKISHPNIVAVYDVNEADGTYYIAMEYHSGGDLKDRLKQGVSLRDALRITKEVARALDYAHSKGYLHRDIKPDNILFRNDGSAVLTDFGIAKALEGDANLTQMGMVAGTPKYMSPEQARGQSLDADSDLYSLGVVLHEMLTGRLPFEASDPIALGILHMNAPIPKLEGRMAHFQPLLDRLLAKQAAQRPQSGAQLIREIEALEKGFDFDSPAEPPSHDSTIIRPAARNKTSAGNPAVAVAAPAPADATVLTPAAQPAAAPVAVAATVEKSSPLPKVAAGVALLAVLGGGGWWYSQNSAAAVHARELATELSAGKAAAARNAWLEPAQDSALSHYQRALVMAPDNAEAKAGIEQIVQSLLTQAKSALAAGQTAQAERLLVQAEGIAPAAAGLADLKQALLAAQTARPANVAVAKESPRVATVAATAAPAAAPGDALQRLRISGMLGGARQALADGDADTAVSRYEQVLKIDPQNREAKDGLRQARAK
ncbi:MAG TPA: serine/threonine-protein kinase [Moraxellaceae bacterium]